jgi:hypothetical protein
MWLRFDWSDSVIHAFVPNACRETMHRRRGHALEIAEDGARQSVHVGFQARLEATGGDGFLFRT